MPNLSLREDHISQLPALKLLMNMGWRYLSPDEALAERGGKLSQVLLEDILKQQLRKINSIEYKGESHPFSDKNLDQAVRALRDLPQQNGFLAANQAGYELLTLGRSFEEVIGGNKKSYSFRYIDWQEPENNVFHVTEEFSVSRHGMDKTYRPDVVLFVNGIPLMVIECKSPRIKSPIDQAIEQNLRNQREDGIRSLYQYSQLVMSVATNVAKYATTGTKKEFWSVWKELYPDEESQTSAEEQLKTMKNRPLPESELASLFSSRYESVQMELEYAEMGTRTITEQDRMLFSLCQPKRLLDLVLNFVLFDAGIKKITRYQQYFAVRKTLSKVATINTDGRRVGGVIWHTQGSGKSLTMVMLAQLIASHPKIKNPKIILVTDRIDLDDQITDTFKKCDIEVKNANSGQHLAELLADHDDAVITTLIHKFESAVRKAKQAFDSPDIFVLVDEGHRSQYGTFNVKMQQVFPKGCFVAFTGTPLMKKEKNTAHRFGGLIDVYSITDAVADGAVVPLLYEGRLSKTDVNAKPIDNFFNKLSEPLNEYGKANLKRKFSSADQLNKANPVIQERVWDIVDHFEENVQGVTFGGLPAKGQLVAPNKTTAIRYRKYLKETSRVSCEVLISPPDMRESHDDAFEESQDEVLNFWKAMLDKYGTKEAYEDALIQGFKKRDEPEIIIVVDKLLTGFDAPNNYVLYLTRQLQNHTLLQAIARVNRLAQGKEHGLIIDYYGNLKNLDTALEQYSGSEDFDPADLAGTVTKILEETKKLPQAHRDVWAIFKSVANKYDENAYQELLADAALRHEFYEKVSVLGRLMKLALSSLEFVEQTPEKLINTYKKDAKFFLELRPIVKRRYFDDLEFKEYESQVQKLIDQHITTEGEVERLTGQVDIFDQKQREAEVEKLKSNSAKADHIAHRTLRAIDVKMDEDPVFFKKFSRMIRDTIEAYQKKRLSEVEYLQKIREHENRFFGGIREDVPENLVGNEAGLAIYNLVKEVFGEMLNEIASDTDVSALTAEGIDKVIRKVVFEDGSPIIDWEHKSDLEGKIRIEIDDFLHETKETYSVELAFDEIDTMVEAVLVVAKRHYGGKQ